MLLLLLRFPDVWICLYLSLLRPLQYLGFLFLLSSLLGVSTFFKFISKPALSNLFNSAEVFFILFNGYFGTSSFIFLRTLYTFGEVEYLCWSLRSPNLLPIKAKFLINLHLLVFLLSFILFLDAGYCGPRKQD